MIIMTIIMMTMISTIISEKANVAPFTCRALSAPGLPGRWHTAYNKKQPSNPQSPLSVRCEPKESR